MISRYNHKDLTWIDLESPTREEILHIQEEFHLPSILGEEIYSSTIRSKVNLYPNCIYLILHFPVISKKNIDSTEQEIDFIIGKNWIITVRYEKFAPLQSFQHMLETAHGKEKLADAKHAGYLFTEMMKQIYKSSLHALEDVTAEIKNVEKRIFNGEEEAMVKVISHTTRKLLDVKQAIRFHRDILESFEKASKQFFDEQYGYYASLIISEYNKVSNVLESNREIIGELQRTNDSLLSTKTNDIMRTFTIMTFVMIPLSVITGIFGMNTVSELIFIRSLSDFFFIIAAMILLAIVMFLFFRLRKWL